MIEAAVNPEMQQLLERFAARLGVVKRDVLAPYAKYRSDPVGFVQRVLGVLEIEEYQKEVLQACVDNPRVAWKAAHGAGKTCMLAWIVLWWLLTRAFSRVIILAPAFERQVGRYLIPEVKKWARQAPVRLPLNILTGAVEVEGYGREWYALAVQATDSSKVEGAHAGDICVIADEAKGLSEDIIAALHGTQTDIVGDRLFLLCSVPGIRVGPFYDIWASQSDLWVRHSTPAWESTRVSETWIEERRREWGERSFNYQTRVASEFADDASGGLWDRSTINRWRTLTRPDLDRIVVAIDPSASKEGDECGIVAVGSKWLQNGDGEKSLHGYVLEDLSGNFSPAGWAKQAVGAYHELQADRIIGERNNGGEMVERVLRTVDGGTHIAYNSVWASRGKQIRAEPAAALYEEGRVHHVGRHEGLEDQMCNWVPGNPSPDRVDALVWALAELFPLFDRLPGDYGVTI